MQETQLYKVTGQIAGSIDQVDKLLAEGKAELSIDLSGCTFISVEGLEWLEEMLMRANSLQAKVNFVRIPPVIYKVFKVAHIDNILEACGSPAVASSLPPSC